MILFVDLNVELWREEEKSLLYELSVSLAVRASDHWIVLDGIAFNKILSSLR